MNPNLPLHVLTIDDDPAMTEYLATLLSSQGYDVTESNKGAEGIRLAREIKPDIILLDLKMPDMDGWQVCRSLREFSNVPILVVSAFDEPKLVASALDAGADDYVRKPVPGNVLLALLNKLTRQASRSNHSVRVHSSAAIS
jgi:two-component system KDP operon response regulator KdpE